MLGVLKAVERFDPERGTPFAAFAVPTVVGELRRHFRDRGWMVRVPRRVQDLHLRIGTVVSELSQQLGRSPTPREIADAAGVRDEDVLEALDAGNRYRPDVARRRATGADGDARLGRLDIELVSVEDRATLLQPAAAPARARAPRHVHALLRGHDAGGDRRGDRRQPDARLATADAQSGRGYKPTSPTPASAARAGGGSTGA